MSGILDALIQPALLAAAITFIGTAIRDLLRRRGEVRSINTAFLAEVQRLIVVVRRHSTWWNELPRPGYEIHPLIPFTHPVYTTHSKNIGKLEPPVAGKVAKLYGYIQFLNALQATREQYLASNNYGEFDKLYKDALKNFLEAFEDAFREDFAKRGLT